MSLGAVLEDEGVRDSISTGRRREERASVEMDSNKKRFTIDCLRFIGSLSRGNVAARLRTNDVDDDESGEGDGGYGLTGEESIGVDGTGRLEKTPRNFWKRPFFVDTGDTRPGLSVISGAERLRKLSARELENDSLTELPASTGDGASKIGAIDSVSVSFFSSCCFTRCRCSTTRERRLGELIATLIELRSRVRK